MIRLSSLALVAVLLAGCGPGAGEASPETAGTVATTTASAETAPELDAESDAPRREITDGSGESVGSEDSGAATSDAAPAAADGSGEASCRAQVGEAAAKALVDICLNVSPATRPPCNAANSCAMIEEEIRRGCNLLGDDAPEDCPRM